MVLPSVFYWHSTLLHNLRVPTGLENSGGFLLKLSSVYIKSTKTHATACTWEDIWLNILLFQNCIVEVLPYNEMNYT